MKKQTSIRGPDFPTVLVGETPLKHSHTLSLTYCGSFQATKAERDKELCKTVWPKKPRVLTVSHFSEKEFADPRIRGMVHVSLSLHCKWTWGPSGRESAVGWRLSPAPRPVTPVVVP